MYVLAVDGEDIPLEFLKQHARGKDIRFYHLDNNQAQEVQLLLNKMKDNTGCCSAGDHKASMTVQEDIHIYIQTFGNFEVFVDGRPLHFQREKAKELFAYLVDRHGSSVTTQQIAVVLWENEEYDSRLKNKVTRTVSSLKKTFKDAGIGDILIKSWNHLAVDVNKIRCDAYDYERQVPMAVNSFRGEYMANYSWAEFTTGKYVQMYHKWNGTE